MNFDKLEARIRELGIDLAWEEETGISLRKHVARKVEHNRLLEKLYRLQKRMG